MGWNKVKSLFVTSEEPQKSDADVIAKELASFEVPPGEIGSLPADSGPTALAGEIDFQALYDQAGIPNTDEVEALEKFLGGLDESLPQASKIAAAKAFLGAIGKSPNDVVADAGRKIAVVRTVEEAKREDTGRTLAREQKAIDDLARQIEEHRAAMEMAQKDLESVRSQCAVEEARLQGARVFFGALGAEAPAAAPGGKKR